MNRILLILISSIFLLVSCVKDNIKMTLFEKVESCMESHPNIALTLLKQIEHPEDLREKELADYALLLTQAYDKMYMDSLQSDSLIEFATKYYSKNEGERMKAGKAFFYYGRVMTFKRRYIEAMQAYLKAQTFVEGTNEYKIQGLIWEYIGYLISAQGNYDSAISHFKRSIECYKLVNARSCLLNGYRNVARGYIAIHHNDSANRYADEGLALSDTSSTMRSSFLQILGRIANENKQYSLAISYFQSAIKCSDKFNEKCRYNLSLGNTYLDVEQDEKAIECFYYSRNSTDLFVSSGSYNSLYKVYRKHLEYDKALTCKEKSDSLLEIVRNNELQAKIVDLQSKYKNENLILENKQIKLEKENQMYLSLFVVALMVGIAIAVCVFLRKKYQKLVLRDVELIRSNNLIIEKYACKIAELESANVYEDKVRKEDIGKLNRKILCLTTENKRLRENTNVDALFVLEELKQGRLIVENMTISERKHLFDFMDLVHADFVTRLKKDFALSKNELLLAVLLKIGFSNKELAYVFGCEMKSLYKYRQRLKQSLMLDRKESLDQMIMLY